ncbi:MAG: formylglycine-generating enzyme family protein [Mojavia pulchra JT2-VF2]|jgi:formylglycine-generating enzyme required for sulfatase activity|uniref:Formylglycine-generating enzyme family protein n=1 Tax=Mojavia pulchra JT2-VF2 TaxID=287848 RepID=A0A951PW70_9NOST|nr:formylglycine-generating enzyme family protein [Mojavia pulchra JT2-VF2]
MEFVVIDEVGNREDPIYGFGHVPYIYEIGKFEITNEEYAEFLNAVAKYDDPYSLYSPSMSMGLFGGIDRFSKEGIYVYHPKQGWGKRPVVYVSWYDLARLANWYHYKKPCTGRAELGTTEGTNNLGAYDTRNFPKDHTVMIDYRKLPFRRNKKALYWIPNENEWYKAAHYDPTINSQRKYWDYPVRTNNVPNNSEPPGDEYSVNFFRDTFAIGKPDFLTEVGAYRLACTYFGTYDQGGNVWEWLENWRLEDRGAEKVRAVRGGSATYSEIGLHARNTDPGNPSHEKFIWGGRLARAHVTSSGKVHYSKVSYIPFDRYLKKIIKKILHGNNAKKFLNLFKKSHQI